MSYITYRLKCDISHLQRNYSQFVSGNFVKNNAGLTVESLKLLLVQLPDCIPVLQMDDDERKPSVKQEPNISQSQVCFLLPVTTACLV